MIGDRRLFSFRELFSDPEKSFLILSSLFGLLFLLALPPFQVADEPVHFYRAYQIADGGLVSYKSESDKIAGGSIPKSLIMAANIWCDRIPFKALEKVQSKQFSQTLWLPLNKEDRAFVSFATSVYSPIAYIPQVLGITISKAFNLPVLWILYLSRLTTLIVTTLIVYLAIKLIPVYKWLFALMALTPMAISQRASLSADALLNGTAFLILATIINCSCNCKKDRVLNYEVALIAVLGLVIALSKQIYFLLPFLCFLIPSEKFINRRRYWLSCLSIVLVTVLAWLTWSFILKNHVGIATHPLIDASVERQTEFLLSQPLVIFTLAWNCFQDIERIFREYIGVLGWLDTTIPVFVTISYQYVLVLIALISRESSCEISLAQKLKIFSVLAVTLFLLYLSQYMTFTPVGAMAVHGMQGRYFIPVAPLFFLLFYNNFFSVKISEKKIGSLVVYYLIFALTASWLAVVARYYLS